VNSYKNFLSLIIIGFLISCAPKKKDDANNQPSENEQQLDDPTPAPSPVDPPVENPPTEVPRKSMILKDEYFVRILINGVLEPVGVVPVRYMVSVPTDAQSVNHPYRNSEGQVVVSATGFLGQARIDKRPSQANEPWTKWDDLNKLPGGLYISTTIDQLP
jgi:hypothetical protein